MTEGTTVNLFINRLQTTKPIALAALTLALVAQAVWFAMELAGGSSPLLRPAIFTGVFLAVAITRGKARWINAAARFAIAGAFLLALWNRFDNFDGFIRYTGLVNSFMPTSTIPALAVLATIAEITCSILMFAGFRVPLAALASGVLLFLFATAMTISGLEQFSWAVYVLAAGGWTLSTVDATAFGVDALFHDKSKEELWKSHAGTR